MLNVYERATWAVAVAPSHPQDRGQTPAPARGGVFHLHYRSPRCPSGDQQRSDFHTIMGGCTFMRRYLALAILALAACFAPLQASAHVNAQAVQEINITLSEFMFTPSTFTVMQGQ